MSLNIAQRLPTPSDEWAEHTAHALNSTSRANLVVTPNDMRIPPSAPLMATTPSVASSALSTPGLDIPGAFPKFKSSEKATAVAPTNLNERAPHAALERLSDAAPPKDLTDLDVDTLKKEAARLLETARQYLPESDQVKESVSGTVGSVGESVGGYLPEREKVAAYLPEGVANTLRICAFYLISSSISAFTQNTAANKDDNATSPVSALAADLDPTSPAKPEIVAPSVSTSDVDAASVRAIPPSTRTHSYQMDNNSDTTSGTNFGAYLGESTLATVNRN